MCMRSRCRDAIGRFPDYPTEEEGGSVAIFKEKDPAEVQAELEAMVSWFLGNAYLVYSFIFKFTCAAHQLKISSEQFLNIHA